MAKTYKSKAKRTLILNESRTQELDMLCIVLTTSKTIPASPADIITSEDSCANKNNRERERESFCLEAANLRAERNALKEEVEMLNMKMPFNYVGTKGDS